MFFVQFYGIFQRVSERNRLDVRKFAFGNRITCTTVQYLIVVLIGLVHDCQKCVIFRKNWNLKSKYLTASALLLMCMTYSFCFYTFANNSRRKALFFSSYSTFPPNILHSLLLCENQRDRLETLTLYAECLSLRLCFPTFKDRYFSKFQPAFPV